MLDKTFQPTAIETTLYQKWEASGAMQCQTASSKPAYTIMMPPPNITGTLHIGHALTYTLQDVLVRFKRLQGFDVLWQPGTDHAGIATQMVVERQLAQENQTRHDLGREAFLKRVWEWKTYSGDTIVQQQKRLGITPDWTRQRFTLDEGLSAAVRQVFVQLHKDGLIYRDKRLVNWDSQLQTAVSDLEVIPREVNGSLWYLRYFLVGVAEPGFIDIATTRPETLLGDVAIAVHPDDTRYQHLIGQQVYVPLTNRTVPIIADTYCDPDKGTGAVKITPAHDFNDFDVGQRHHLPLLNILDPYMRLNDDVPNAYQGLSLPEARQRILTDLEASGQLLREEKIRHAVPFGERSGIEIQPWLTDQWFLDAKVLAQPALQAVETGQTTFVPTHWENTYFEWLRHIQPWCISRQIWWGHQIPAWYGPDGHVFVAETEAEAQHQAHEHYAQTVTLRPETDVLDTWFSSALWPFTTLGWPDRTPELEKYYPTAVLNTGFDIIFFWVARMMMMGLYFMKDVPFKTVYIHGLVRDDTGAKMSKSKGNIVDPLLLLDEYGCDAVRFTLALLAVPGRDLKISTRHVEHSRNFMTKIWNAARFLQMNQCTHQDDFNPECAQLTLNLWIYAEAQQLVQDVTHHLNHYRFDEAAQALYHFFWGTYCDHYLEFLKPCLDENALPQESEECRAMAVWVLRQFLCLANPIIPYITETLWAVFGGQTLLIHHTWPDVTVSDDSKQRMAQQEIQWLINLIAEIRSYRAAFRVPAAAYIPLQLYGIPPHLAACIADYRPVLMRLARLEDIQLSSADLDQAVDGAVQFILETTTVVLPLSETIDLAQEAERLRMEEKKLLDIQEQIQKRLANPDFLEKGKPEVIAENRARLAQNQATLTKIAQALERISS